jgi:hypothetical protein
MVSADAQSAVDAAVESLVAQGFTRGSEEFSQKLRASGSEWVAQDVRLGDVKKSRAQELKSWVADGFGLELLPAFWRPVTPTLVVACARVTDQGTELIVYPHKSTRGSAPRNDAFPHLRAAMAALESGFAAQGGLISREAMFGIKNDGSPASQKVVKELLGWR